MKEAKLYFISAESGYIQNSCKLLELNMEVNPKDDERYTPLHRALQYWNLDIAWLLLTHRDGADVNVRNHFGNTPLHLAANNGLVEVAQKLLELNADVNSRDDTGRTPLLIASCHSNSGVLQLLLDHNANVHVHDHRGNTPLHHAALSCRLEVARILLKHGVEVDSWNAEGSTPLHLAAGSKRRQNGGKDFVQLLLDHGADAQACDLSGKTPSDRASEALTKVVIGSNQTTGHNFESEDIVRLVSQYAAK